MKSWMFLTALLCSAIITGCGNDSSTNSDNGNGNGSQSSITTIAYSSSQDGIVLIESDGTNKRVLVPGESGSTPIWSPDKSKVVFVWGNFLMVVDTAGKVDTLASGIQRLGFGEAPWSPDGNSITFEGYLSNEYRIYVVSVTVGPPTHVLSSAVEASFLTNTDIVCAYAPSGEIDSTIIVRITSSGTGLDSLAWSPTGKYFRPRVSHDLSRITYAFIEEGGNWDYNNEVWIMNTDGSGKQNIVSAGTFDGFIRGMEFRFDDAKLLCVPDRDDLTTIWVVDIVSKVAASIPGVLCDESSNSATWSRSANQVAFVIRESGGIAVVNEDGTGYLKIVDTLARSVDW